MRRPEAPSWYHLTGGHMALRPPETAAQAIHDAPLQPLCFHKHNAPAARAIPKGRRPSPRGTVDTRARARRRRAAISCPLPRPARPTPCRAPRAARGRGPDPLTAAPRGCGAPGAAARAPCAHACSRRAALPTCADLIHKQTRRERRPRPFLKTCTCTGGPLGGDIQAAPPSAAAAPSRAAAARPRRRPAVCIPALLGAPLHIGPYINATPPRPCTRGAVAALGGRAAPRSEPLEEI